MNNTPFSSWPSYTIEEADAVHEVILSNKVNYWTGSECRYFEKEFAVWSGSDYAVALGNGTQALDVALKALNIGDGDEVIVASRTFIASASSIVNAGAIPIFADIDLDSQNITVKSIESLITSKAKAIICVHLAGWPCEMDEILDLAKKFDLYVIEDCAQAHGALYKGRPVGSIGHVGCWSFCQDKIMTTCGEGGMVTTSIKVLWEKMWAYKDHGKSYEAVYEQDHLEGFRWLHDNYGSNYRMTEMQAALGVSQMSRLHDFVAKRNKLAAVYDDLLKSLPLITPKQINDSYSGRHLYVIRLKLDEISLSHKEVFEQLRENGIGVNLHYIPVHTQPYYKNLGFKQGQFPIAESYYGDAISVPLSYVMTNEQQNEVVTVLSKVLV